MIKINSKKIEVNPETFQPLIKVNLDIELNLEYMQDTNSKTDSDYYYMQFGAELTEAIRNFKENI